MDRLEKRLRRLLPRKWRRREGGSAEDLAVARLREAVVVKNLQQMAFTASLASNTPPPPELVQEQLLLRENRTSFRRRREDTWHGPSDSDLPFIDCDVAVAELSSPLGTSIASVASSLPQLTRQGPELGSTESGYLSALSMSPTSFERLTPKALRIRQTSQEAVNLKSTPRVTPMLQKKSRVESEPVLGEDDVDRFMKGWVYKTKYVTTVFEAKGGGLGDVVEDSAEEIRRWLDRRRMLVAACEVHFSVPEEKRCRREQQRLKTTLLAALRDNNQRILNLRRGRALAPIQLVESRTEEKIDREKGCIQGVYLKAYNRLLRYSHWETPDWHKPYWQLPTGGSCQPRPGHFLWNGEDLSQTAVVAVNILLLTARHLHSGVSTTRLLRATFTPSSRPAPFFPEGSPLYFPFHKTALIGQIEASADDVGPVFYYLIPSCSPSTPLFSLNASSGELFHSGPESPKNSRVELCVLSTTAPISETASLIYRPERKDMTLVVVVYEAEEDSTMPDLLHLNNTVTTTDRQLSALKMSFSEQEIKFYNFSVEGVSFTPSETVLPLTTAAPLPSLFAVDRRGIVRASPTIATQPSGVYTVHVEAKAENEEVLQIQQEFHLVPPSARLRFIFDRRLAPISQDFSSFSAELREKISKSDVPPLRLVMDTPKLYVYNTSRSSVCFHAVGPSSLLSPQTTLAALGKVSDLFQVYNNFSVVDIETSCEEPKSIEIPVAAALASPTSLLLISVLALGILVFSMICVYFCFIRRYRDYLRAKEKAMKGPVQTVPPTPTFVLTPPTPASPAMAPLGYWEG